ncbi:Protein MEI2-like 4, partial [Cucurbita argyrosperma subsp. sororia]
CDFLPAMHYMAILLILLHLTLRRRRRFLSHLKSWRPKTIGNLLPDDDDLLAGVVNDGLDCLIETTGEDDAEDLDFLAMLEGWIWVMTAHLLDRKILNLLEDYLTICWGCITVAMAGEHPLGEHPSRTLFDNPSEKDINQGTLVVFNLETSVSNEELRQIFGVYGEIKEIREAPHRSHYKFIEFYDIRAAEAALCALNLSDIAGKQIKLEPSHPGAVRRSVPSSLPSVMRSESFGKQSGFIDSGHSPSPLKLGIRAAPAIHPHSLPEHPDSLNNNVHCNSLNTIAGNISLRPPERADSRQLFLHLVVTELAPFLDHIIHGVNSYRPQPPAPSVVWPNSPSYMNGIPAAHTPTQVHGVPRAASHLMHTVLPMNNHHVGSAPAVNPSIWDRQHAYAGGIVESLWVSFRAPYPQRNVGLQSHHQRCMVFPGRGQILPMMNSFDSSNERGRSRRNEAASNQADKKQYELDIDRILRGEDNRTTLMIKNIPNKYTSKMLLAAIDERHRGTYDFIYLPIDFKASFSMFSAANKCNVGYAFINMTDPSLIIPFYEAFNGKKWEKFNSEKVASLAYARIQGKAALIAHFQNSSLMNEDKRCRPILFNTDGPNAGDQVPFPMGVNVRTRPGKGRTNTQEENPDEGLLISGNGENCSSGDASSSCVVKDLEQPVP